LIGPIVVLGQLAAMVFAAIEGAVVVGGLSVLGAAIFSLGIPKDSVLEYEKALKADSFLLVTHGPPEEMLLAQTILKTFNPEHLHVHHDVPAEVLTPVNRYLAQAAA